MATARIERKTDKVFNGCTTVTYIPSRRISRGMGPAGRQLFSARHCGGPAATGDVASTVSGLPGSFSGRWM
jgi:hypothetical protein